MMTQHAALHAALIDWFQSHAEDLPWRAGRDPYRVWLSEIMLQQTQVATVIPYYLRFLQAFPDVFALAAAPLDQVLKLWEGLGYYSRARNLHRAAQVIAQDYHGHFPSTLPDLLKLPGIGRYTAGAIASLAFSVDAPVLDGNVIRVLSRLFNIDSDVTLASTKDALWQLAEELIPVGQAGLWNEGLMEFGRLICVPSNPLCHACPVADWCLARPAGVQELRPVKPPRKKLPHYDVVAAVIHRPDGQILIAQRPHHGMLGGLWEFPGGKRELGETLPECLRREIAEELGIEIEVGQPITTVKHAYTHFRITLVAFLCRHVSGAPQALGCLDWVWATLDDFDHYAFPVTDRKIIRHLRDGFQMSFEAIE